MNARSSISIAMILVCGLLASCGNRKSGEPSVAKQAASPQPAAETPNSSQETYRFRRKGNSKSAAADKSLDGVKLVEGLIKGLIVQKGDVTESQSKDNPSKKTFTVSYELTNGNEIAAIDEEGVHQDSDKVFFLNVSQEDTPPDDNEVLETGMNISEQAFSPVLLARTSAGGLVVRISGKSKAKQRTNANVLLGEYRIDPDTKKARLIPALEVSTAGGVVTIPVQNILKFRQKPK